jgi:hypothetical protein
MKKGRHSLKKQPDSHKGKLGKGDPIISFLLLEEDSFPVDAFLEQTSKTRIVGKAVSDIGKRGDVFSFSIGDEYLAMIVMPAPYPDLEEQIATSWVWPSRQSIETVKRHRSHLLITAMFGTADPIRRRLIVTAVSALAAKQPGVMAVCWPEANLVHFPPVFINLAEEFDSPEEPPLYLWVDLRAFKNEDGTTGLFTIGLSALGHVEIEIPRIKMEPGELREWLLNIMRYLLKKGPVLKHGQTIGMTAEQRIRILHCPSSFGHPGTVIRLEP